MTAESNSTHWKSTAKVLLSLGLLFGLIALVDHNSLLASIKAADPQLLLACFALLPLQAIFESGRLKIVFASFCLDFLGGVRLFFISMFFGNFMPGPIGADVYQIYHMHTIRPGLLRPVSLSIFLRLNGLFINLLLAIVAMSLGTKAWMNAVDIHRDYLIFPVWIIFIILSVLLLMAVMIAAPWGRSYLRLLYGKFCGLFREFFDSVRSFSVNQHISITALGIFVVLLRVASSYILVQAFGSSIGCLDMIFIVTVATLASLLPIGFGGLGVREISLTALLIAFAVAPSEAVAVSLIGRCFIWVLSLVGGVWFILDRTRSKANT